MHTCWSWCWDSCCTPSAESFFEERCRRKRWPADRRPAPETAWGIDSAASSRAGSAEHRDTNTAHQRDFISTNSWKHLNKTWRTGWENCFLSVESLQRPNRGLKQQTRLIIRANGGETERSDRQKHTKPAVQLRGLHGLKTEARTRPVPEIVWPDPTRAAQLNLEPEPDPKGNYINSENESVITNPAAKTAQQQTLR